MDIKIFLKKLAIIPVISFLFSCSSAYVSSGTISTNESEYKPGETIKIEYNIIGAEVGDCVAIALAGSDLGTNVAKNSASGYEDGIVSFRAGGLGKKYVARYFFNCELIVEGLAAESDTFSVSYD